MSTPAAPARIHLIPAKEAPYVAIIRRKPSRWFHIVRWNTETDAVEHGSWFWGSFYPKRCDVSFDGQWMIYLAYDMAHGEDRPWNGVCRLPFLKTIAECENVGAWLGGGYWRDKRTLLLNARGPLVGTLPFRVETLTPKYGAEDLSVFIPRLERDGWKRQGKNYGEDREVTTEPKYTLERIGDEGWYNQPAEGYPMLRTRYIGYLKHGYTFAFSLDEHPELIDQTVDSACWDSQKNLIFSRNGIVYRYSLDDLAKKKPGFVLNLESLTPRSTRREDNK